MNSTYKNITPHSYTASTPCPICGNQVISGVLFCEMCGMRIHNHQCGNSVSKANFRSTYLFYDERDYNNARDAIYGGNSTIYYKLDWRGDYGYVNGHDHAWRVDLFDDLTPEELDWVVGRIREHRGTYYHH